MPTTSATIRIASGPRLKASGIDRRTRRRPRRMRAGVRFMTAAPGSMVDRNRSVAQAWRPHHPQASEVSSTNVHPVVPT
jgi:hypothetical protein